MQTLSQLPEEGQKDIARSLGYMGKKVGFPAFLQANPKAAKEYQDLEDAFRRNQMFAQERRMSMAEGGMYMGRFDQDKALKVSVLLCHHQDNLFNKVVQHLYQLYLLCKIQVLHIILMQP